MSSNVWTKDNSLGTTTMADHWSVNDSRAVTTNVHRYPLFIAHGEGNTDEDREIAKECIKFTAVKQGGVSIDAGQYKRGREAAVQGAIKENRGLLGKITNQLESGVNQLLEKTISQSEFKERENSLRKQRQETNEAIGRLEQGKLDDVGVLKGLGDALGSFITEKRTQITATEEIKETAFLYMPPSIVFNEGATWGKEALGAAGNAVQRAVKGGDIGSILKEFGIGVAPEVGMAAALGATAKIGGILSAAGLGALGQGIPSAIGQQSRITQNPYEEQLFQGIDFRVFSFQFEFNAVSYAEYEMVRKIIKMFRKNSKPTFTISSDNQALYSYPNEFKIEFMHLAESSESYVINKNIPRIHNCVLTNITTNYTPSEWRAHENGEPNSILVQLAFTETVKITQADIEGDY